MFLAHFYVQYNPKADFNTWPEILSFTYGTIINIIAIYTFAIWGKQAYKKQPFIRTLIQYNLVFILILVIGETIIDAIFQWYYNDFYQVKERNFFYYKGLLQANLLFTLFIMAMANLYALSLSWMLDRQAQELKEKERLKAELALMKHQVQPHFLFNTLNNLFGLACEAGNEKVADGISRLAEIMRYMTYETAAEKVALERELQYLKSYIELQKLRIGTQVAVNYEFTGQVQNQQIAPLLLLPFVENTFKHGISFIDPSPIQINIEIKESALILKTKNKCYPKKEKIESGGFGLENVQQRLELIYPDQHELRIKNEGNAFDVNLKIENL